MPLELITALRIMQQFDAWGVAMLLRHIDERREFAKKMIGLGGSDEKVHEAGDASGIVIMTQHHAERAALQSTYDRVWHNGPFCTASQIGMTWQELDNELKVLRECIEADLAKRSFAFLAPERVNLFANLDEVWGAVADAIPEAKIDIKDGHIAYMTELHTATVFHFMRVAEHGLRVLAKKLRGSLDLKHKKTIVPIEYAEWNKVIEAIKNKVAKISQQRQGPKRQAMLEKFSDAGDHCTFMKDIWRNTVSHARQPYSAPEALGVLERVRDFMLFIANNFAKAEA